MQKQYEHCQLIKSVLESVRHSKELAEIPHLMKMWYVSIYDPWLPFKHVAKKIIGAHGAL